MHNCHQKYNFQFDAETFISISAQLSALTQNILEIDKELRMLRHLTDNPQMKKDQT